VAADVRRLQASKRRDAGTINSGAMEKRQRTAALQNLAAITVF